MKTRRVTETWEYYRDNCHCLKEPMRRKLRSLDEYVAELEELVVQAHECKTNDGYCEDCYQDEECCPIERRMDELGIPRGQ